MKKTTLSLLTLLSSFSAFADMVLVTCVKPETQVIATLSTDPTNRIRTIHISQAGVPFRVLRSESIGFFPSTIDPTRAWKEILMARRQKIFELQVDLPLESIPGSTARYGVGQISANATNGTKLHVSQMNCLVF